MVTEPLPGHAGSMMNTTSELKKLTRPQEGRMLFGVCAGVANYLKVDVTIVRLIMVALALFTAGTAVVAYLVGWLLIPEEETSVHSSPVSATSPPQF